MRWVAALLLLLGACASPDGLGRGGGEETFVVASTTSTQDSGLLDLLVPLFEADHPGLRVKVVAVGSGEAMDLGERGDADVLLVHSPEAERTFMQAGHGEFRRPVMRNDFVLAGPPGDPAGVAQAMGTLEAFRLVAAGGHRFLSRGDRSGTHLRELAIWGEASFEPRGEWYLETGQGMAETIAVASEVGAYVLTDSATFVVVSEGTLRVLFEGGEGLVNPYSVIPVTRAGSPEAAGKFAEWITSERGQDLIGSFGVEEFGRALFVPETR